MEALPGKEFPRGALLVLEASSRLQGCRPRARRRPTPRMRPDHPAAGVLRFGGRSADGQRGLPLRADDVLHSRSYRSYFTLQKYTQSNGEQSKPGPAINQLAKHWRVMTRKGSMNQVCLRLLAAFLNPTFDKTPPIGAAGVALSASWPI